MLRTLASALGLASMLWLSAAQALGLGDIDVRSRLNQRFNASIPVLSATSAELESLTVRIADPEEFARTGIERSDYLSSVTFAVTGSGSATQIKVSSDQASRDPFLNFVVEARWNGGKLLREYTVLLDPPGGSPTVAAPAPSQAPTASAVPKTAGPKSPLIEKPRAQPDTPAATVSGQAAKSYGPVQANQTLWSIAKNLRIDPSVTMDQMLLALYEGNPQAFEGGINGLLTGSRLKVPSTEEAKAVDVSAARARIAALRGLAPATTAPTPAVTKPAPAPVPASPAAAPVPTPAPAPVAVEKPAVIPAPAPSPAPAAVPAPAPEAASPGPAKVVPAEEAPAPAAPVVEVPTAAAPAAEAVVEKPIETPPAAAPTPVPATAETSWTDDLPLPLIGGLLALILALVAALVLRRRKAAEDAARSQPKLIRAAEAPWLDSGTADPLLEKVKSKPPEAPKPLADDTPTLIAPVAAAAAFPVATENDDTLETPASVARSIALNVDASDPLTEADFHLAYGLYDEAAQMLKQAIASDPERTELQVKLAETYAAAAKPVEFQEVAEELRGRVSDYEWQKIAAMGRSLSPTIAMFGAAPATLAPMPTEAPAASLDELSVIDFDLDTESPPPEPMAPLATASAMPMLDLEMDAAAPSSGLLGDIDLSSFDLDSESPESKADANRIDFNLDELDLDKVEESGELPAMGDEIDTKLDLARAYADMGDNDAARGLLSEVIEGGNPQQQQEARTLTQRLQG